MAPKKDGSAQKVVNKGAWTSKEDAILGEYIEIHGAKRWKTIAAKSGLNRCGKSCRLRWLNYLRPNIKRGNISDDEEDLILRLHKLLGNRWSLIAGRLPGRTDNEIKNYWNSHLSKRIKEKSSINFSTVQIATDQKIMSNNSEVEEEGATINVNLDMNFDVDGFFDFSTEASYGLDWVNTFLELEDDPWHANKI